MTSDDEQAQQREEAEATRKRAEAMLRQHGGAMYRAAFRACGNQSLAEDACQDALEAVLEYGWKIDRIAAFAASVAHKKGINVLRREGTLARARERFLQEQMEAIVRPMDDRTDRSVPPSWVVTLITSLPADGKALFQEMTEGLRFRQMAAKRGISEKAVQGRWYRLERRLRKQMQKLAGEQGPLFL